jgi:GntR family transcriptional regulator
MYRTIAEDLRDEIASGRLRPGAQLPPEAELRERYAASRNTIRDAIKWLMALGLVETRPGQGTFVIRRIDPVVNTIGGGYPADGVAGRLAEVASQGRRARLSPLQLEIQAITNSSPVGARLRLAEGTQVISRHQRRFIDDTPWSMQTDFYPMELASRGAGRLLVPEDIHDGALAYINETLGTKMETWRVWLSARLPYDYETQFFELPAANIALAEMHQVYYDQSGTPFCFTATSYPADRNSFRITAGKVPPIDDLRPRPEGSAGRSTTVRSG